MTASDDRHNKQALALGVLLFPDVPNDQYPATHASKFNLCDGPHKVMISYSSPDKRIAEDLCATIEEHGVKCWIAPRNIKDGEVYSGAIVAAIETSSAFVLVMSKSADSSRHVLSEVATAFDKGLPIIALKTDDIIPTAGISYYLRTVHWEVVNTSSLYRHYTEVAKQLCLIL